MHHNLAFIGFGNVGRALVRLLERKRGTLEAEYGITYSVTGIASGSHGFAVDTDGLDVQQALELVEAGKSLAPLSTRELGDSWAVIEASQADVMFENTPVNNATGQPAIDHVCAALEQGMHVCTANKGTVVHGYRELSALARSHDRRFLFEATVLGGSPVFSVFREAMPAAELESFTGILNATTNIILSRMERGETFEQALAYCQSIGVAEADPSNDVDGWDAAIKVAALVTVLMEVPLKPQDVDRTGIRGITPTMIAEAKARGERYKLVCSAELEGPKVKARVAPERVSSASRLFGMQDSTSGVTFRTDVLGDYSIIESEREGLEAGPIPTAYGLFADFVTAVTK
jgi:homoserine dehydrogenase